MARRTPETPVPATEHGRPKVEEPNPIATPEQIADAAYVGIPGGAPGIIPEASKTIKFLGAAISTAGDAEAEVEVPKAVRYRVLPCTTNPDGSWPILYGGVRTYLKQGRTLSESEYDVPYLRSQGVKLEVLEG